MLWRIFGLSESAQPGGMFTHRTVAQRAWAKTVPDEEVVTRHRAEMLASFRLHVIRSASGSSFVRHNCGRLLGLLGRGTRDANRRGKEGEE